MIGGTFSHYRIVEKIGAGGMGIVYRAHDEHLDREVAIKALPPGTLADEPSRKRFRKEALALSRLNHPNIATIHDFDTQDGVDYLVMEYIPGMALSEKLAARPLHEKEVIALGTQLAEGLSAAHERGVVHRDIKPGNLQLTRDGRLKILDFGLAKLPLPVTATATTGSLSGTHTMAGTLLYMAPEQLLGGEIDARTDIHAAGSVLYEMATGQRLFAEVERSQLIDAILHKLPLTPTALNPKLSPELERIIGKCLEKRPENRYQSAKELAIDLKRLERSTEASSPKTEASAGQFMWRAISPRRLLALVSAGILVLAVITAGLLHKHVQTNVQPVLTASIAVLPFADLSASHDQEYFSDGLAEEILNDLSRIPNLKVAARGSAFQFKGKNEDLRDVGRKLNVESVLEGSVRSEGTRVRITAQLVKAGDGFQLWSDSYDRDLKDIFAVQDDIARAVTSSLQLKLLPGKSPANLPTPAIAPEAYQDFLQARHFAHMGDKESVQKALDYINRAIQADASYAPAYAWRAYIALTLGGLAWMDYPEAIKEARRDVEKSIDLDPNLADGYRVLSLIQSAVDGNCRMAETTLKRALELAPGDADNLGQKAGIARCLGRQEEAVELLNQTLALDPLEPGRYLGLAQNLRDLGRYKEAQIALEKALDLNPHKVWVHETQGELYLAQGRAQEALEEMEKEPQRSLHDLGMAIAYKALNRDRESKAALENMISLCPNHCAYQIAQVYAYRGEVDQAFQWLSRARRQHDGGFLYVKTDLLLKSLRGDPRYAQLLKGLNLFDQDGQ
jgi:serine/threonine protein kinase/Tfp pilus assembly protein PilF